jgi:hypothetical protein
MSRIPIGGALTPSLIPFPGNDVDTKQLELGDAPDRIFHSEGPVSLLAIF